MKKIFTLIFATLMAGKITAHYYLNCPTTDGATFQIGMSIDIDKFFK